MTNIVWRTYTGPSLERLARHRAAKFGYRLHRTRRHKGPNNAGQYLLIDKASNIVLLGSAFTATPEMILDFLEQSENQHSPRPGMGTLAPMRIQTSVRTSARQWKAKRDWRTYPDWEWNYLAYYRARQLGCRLRCSRRRGDGKEFMLTKHDVVLLGAGYTATVEDVLEFLEQVRVQ